MAAWAAMAMILLGDPAPVAAVASDRDVEAGGDTQTKDTKKKKKDKKKKDKASKLSWQLGARVMAGWEHSDKRPAEGQSGTPGTSNEFFLRQGRAKLGVDYTKRFKVRISVEMADALKSPSADRVPFLRNAYAGVRFHRAIRLRFGYFKRPFSRLELTSPGTLPIRGRGLANGRILEDRGYGDRSAGGSLWGTVKPGRIVWNLGVFAPGLRAEGIDVVGRVEVGPTKWLSMGSGVVYKHVENGIGDKVDVAAVGADARVQLAGFGLLGDVMIAQDYLVPGEPWSFGVVAIATYDIDLPKKLILQPVVSAEWADTHLSISQNDAVRTIAGLNLIWRKRFRVMPQAEFIRPLGTIGNPWVERDTYYVMLSLQI